MIPELIYKTLHKTKQLRFSYLRGALVESDLLSREC